MNDKYLASEHFSSGSICDMHLSLSLSITCSPGYIPALCCAPNQSVAECLECILEAMLGQKGSAL